MGSSTMNCGVRGNVTGPVFLFYYILSIFFIFFSLFSSPPPSLINV